MQQLCKTIAAILQGILQNVFNRFAKSLQNSCIHIKPDQTCFCMILQTIRNTAWGKASKSLQKICKGSDGERSRKILAVSKKNTLVSTPHIPFAKSDYNPNKNEQTDRFSNLFWSVRTDGKSTSRKNSKIPLF